MPSPLRRRALFAHAASLLPLLALAVGPAARADFTFVHTTDTHVTGSEAPDSPAAKDAVMFKEIAALSPKPAFILNTGDVTESGLEAEFAVYRKVREANLPADLPVFDAPGNHDCRWNPRGKEGFEKGTRQKLWQSFDRENVHFVLLDSTVLLQHWGHFDREQLDWLAKDLAKAGRDKPVVIGFHHFFGRENGSDSAQIDNYAALLDVIRPYNVKLFLVGHGHSDLLWNIDGVPAIMARGLYQGSYHLIQVSKDKLRILRRSEKAPTPTQEVATIPLKPQRDRPNWGADVEVKEGKGTVVVHRGGLPFKTRVEFALGGKTTQLVPSGPGQPRDSFIGEFSTEGMLPGNHRGLVSADVGDGRRFLLSVPVSLSAPDRVAPVWTADVQSGVQSKVVRAGDLLYVPTMGGTLYALDAATGRERWRFATGGAIFSVPLVSQGTVYFGSADHFVYALDAGSGKLKWKTETGGAVLAGAAEAKGIVCIASSDLFVRGLKAEDGDIAWTLPVKGLYQSQAATDGERFFLGGWDQAFRCVEAATGRELWNRTFGRSFYYSPAIGSPRVLPDGRVAVTSNDGLLHVIEVATGKISWESDPLKLGYSGPLFYDGRVYNASLSDLGGVFAFDAAQGKRLWETATGSVIYDSSLAESNGNLFVGSVNGVFSALRADDGALLWRYRLGPAHLLCSPATDEKRVYIANLEGKVFAFPAAAPAAPTSSAP